MAGSSPCTTRKPINQLLSSGRVPARLAERRNSSCGRMTPATRDAEVAVHQPDGIHLIDGRVRTIPVKTPLLDVAVHVVHAPGVGRCPPDVQRDDVVVGTIPGKPAFSHVLVEVRRQCPRPWKSASWFPLGTCTPIRLPSAADTAAPLSRSAIGRMPPPHATTRTRPLRHPPLRNPNFPRSWRCPASNCSNCAFVTSVADTWNGRLMVTSMQRDARPTPPALLP